MSTYDWFSAISAQILALNHDLRCVALTYSEDQDSINAKLVDAVDKLNSKALGFKSRHLHQFSQNSSCKSYNTICNYLHMNKTNILGINPIQDGDTLKAVEYFKKKYPTIQYITEEDRYLYRGYKFDYFKASTTFDTGEAHSFMLVDIVDDNLWLFTYGEDEQRWQNFLTEKAKQKPAKVNKGWRYIISWIFNREVPTETANPVI